MLFIKTPLRALAASVLLLTTLVVTSCKKDDTPAATSNTITDIVTNDSRFTILRAAVLRANLAEALRTGSRTVFAPTDDAFRAYLQANNFANIDAVPIAALTSVLQYHVLDSRVPSTAIATANNTPVQTLLTGANGVVYVTKTSATNVSVNGRNVTQADVAADNGIIHIINGVLVPPSQNVVERVTTDPGNFSLLAAAVNRAGAGVATALTSATAITVFAPTNQAFIDAGLSLSAINAAAPATLARVLTYHVVPGRVFSTNLTDGATPATLAGPTVRVNVGSTVTLLGGGNGTNVSTVVVPNVLTTNAVVHVINRVLLPPP